MVWWAMTNGRVGVHFNRTRSSSRGFNRHPAGECTNIPLVLPGLNWLANVPDRAPAKRKPGPVTRAGDSAMGTRRCNEFVLMWLPVVVQYVLGRTGIGWLFVVI